MKDSAGADIAQSWVWVHPHTGDWYFDLPVLLSSQPPVLVEGPFENENDVRGWLSDLSQEAKDMKINRHGSGFLISTASLLAQEDLDLLVEGGRYAVGGVVVYEFFSPAEHKRMQACQQQSFLVSLAALV